MLAVELAQFRRDRYSSPPLFVSTPVPLTIAVSILFVSATRVSLPPSFVRGMSPFLACCWTSSLPSDSALSFDCAAPGFLFLYPQNPGFPENLFLSGLDLP
jgi:hypothetical protein